MEFREVPFREAVGQIHQAAAKADPETADLKKRGVDLVIKVSEEEIVDNFVTVTTKQGSLRPGSECARSGREIKIYRGAAPCRQLCDG